MNIRPLAVAGVVLMTLHSFFSRPSVLARKEVPQAIGLQGGCTHNLDVIFIIDQSSSMKTNDPYNQRAEAVKNMLDLLVDVALDYCPDSFHRATVISFGMKGKVQIDLPLMDINPDTLEQAQQMREIFRERVQATDLGWTYAMDAFRKADEILEQAPAAPGPRKRVIIWISDGYPCMTETECNDNYYENGLRSLQNQIKQDLPFAASLRHRENCLENLRKTYGQDIPQDRVTGCLERYPVSDADYQQSVYVFTLLLRDKDGSQSRHYNDLLENIHQNGRGALYLLDQAGYQIPKQLQEILRRLVGIRPTSFNCGTFAVNPYLRRMVVNAYKNSTEIKITLSYFDIEGREHKIENGKLDGASSDLIEYTSYGANERYSISFPEPGLWSVSSSATRCEDILVYYDEVTISPQPYPPLRQLPVYERAPYYNQNHPKYIQYKLIDLLSGREIRPSAQVLFAIQATATVKAPDGQIYTYPLEWKEDQQAFVSVEPVRVPIPGQYSLQMVGITRRHEGDPRVTTSNEAEIFNVIHELFRDESIFTVLAVNEVTIEPVSPEANQQLSPIHATIAQGWPLRVLPLQVSVQLKDENGNQLQAGDLFEQPDRALTAYIVYQPQGVSEPLQTEPIYLKLSPRSESEWIGEFTLDTEGPHTLIVEVTEEANNQALEHRFWFYETRLEVPFSRMDCLFCRASTYYVLLGTTMLAMIALVAYNIAIRTNKVAGSLVFVDGTETIAEFGLYNGKNVRVLSKKELAPYPYLALKRLKIRNSRKRSRRRATPKDEVSLADWSVTYEEANTVRVEGVDQAGYRFTFDLYPNTPTPYSNETMAQMVYQPPDR